MGADGDASGTNSLTVFGNVTIDGTSNLDTGQTVTAPTGTFTNSTVSSLLNVNGNADLGSDASDTVTFNGL